jgi:uncharacterized membrane protein YdfJ with MMPL/SSD domain
VIMRPVLLPAAEAVLGRYGWWPTRGLPVAGEGETTDLPRARWRLPRPHLRNHRHAGRAR